MPDAALPRMPCELTFVSSDSDATLAEVKGLHSGSYRPHIVLEEVPAPGANDFLGIAFVNGPSHYRAGQAVKADIVCIYHPATDYSALRPGARFRVLEGKSVVAHGHVLEAPPSTGVPTRTRRIVFGPAGVS